MAILFGIGGEDYTDNVSINAHPNFTASVGYEATLESFLPVPEVGEKWFSRNGTAGNSLQSSEFSLAGNLELEMQDVFIPNATTSTIFNCVMRGGSGGGGFGGLAGARLSTGELRITYDSLTGDVVETIPLSTLTLDEGVAHCFHIRYRRQSAEGVADGVIEIYVDGNSVFNKTDVNAGSIGTNTNRRATWDAAIIQWGSSFSGGIRSYHSNIYNADAFSTADGVAPSAIDVQDLGGNTEAFVSVPYSYYFAAPTLSGLILPNPIVF